MSQIPTFGRVTLIRWLALLGLFALEILALTLRHDSGSLIGQDHWWAVALLLAPHLLRWAVAVFAATLLFAGPAILAELRRSVPHSFSQRQCVYLLAHLAAFIGFERACSFVFSGGLTDSPSPALMLVAWSMLGMASAVFLCLALLPWPVWYAVGTRAWRPLCTAVAVGALAYAGCFLSAALWKPLGAATLVVVANLLRVVEPSTYSLPDECIVGTERFSVEIARHCSGYEGIGLVSVFLAVYLGVNRSRFRLPQAILLLPIGAATIWLTNAFRIALMILIGSRWSPEVALGGFHSQAGWLAFNAVALGIVFVAQRLPFFAHQPEVTRAPRPSAAYLMPFLVVMSTVMLTSALSAGFDYFYPVRVIAVVAVLWYFRQDYRPELQWPSPFALGVGVFVFVLWLGLARVLESPDNAASGPETLAGMPQHWAAAWLLLRVIGSVITVPIAEELAFRGYLLRRLGGGQWNETRPRFAPVAFLISSVLFGLLHDQWVAGILAGMCYAVAYYYRGHLVDAVVAHGITNFLLFLAALFSGNWSIWT